MNYIKIYNNLIKNSKSRIKQENYYYEKHHITPKCMGGNNDADNLVFLTAREHYLCHWLLAKHYNTKNLWNAFSMMHIATNKHERIYNSRHFERLRIARSNASRGENNSMYGKKSACISHTKETKEKISLSKLGKKRTPFNRSPATQETKDKISLSKKGKLSPLKGRALPKFECIHCNKMMNQHNLNRWHGDNCKMKKN